MSYTFHPTFINSTVLLQPGSWFVTKEGVHTVLIRKINSLTKHMENKVEIC